MCDAQQERHVFGRWCTLLWLDKAQIKPGDLKEAQSVNVKLLV